SLASSRALLHLARTRHDEPTVNSQLIRLGDRSFALANIERTLNQSEPGDKELEPVQKLLELECRARPLLIAMRAERAEYDRVFQSLKEGKTSVGRFFGHGHWEYYLPGAIDLNRADSLRFITKLVEAAKLPNPEQTIQFKQHVAEAGKGRIFVREHARG